MDALENITHHVMILLLALRLTTAAIESGMSLPLNNVLMTTTTRSLLHFRLVLRLLPLILKVAQYEPQRPTRSKLA